MEEMNARVMENEVMDETVEVDEAVDSGNAGALVAAVSYTHLTLPTTPYV